MDYERNPAAAAREHVNRAEEPAFIEDELEDEELQGYILEGNAVKMAGELQGSGAGPGISGVGVGSAAAAASAGTDAAPMTLSKKLSAGQESGLPERTQAPGKSGSGRQRANTSCSQNIQESY
jgi:hypothetical protein